jgi:hypothetical protein
MVFNEPDDHGAIRHPRASSVPNESKHCSEEKLRMESIDRRRFLLQGGAAVAAVGVASTVPLTAANALNKGRGNAAHAAVPAGASLDEPVIAHLRNLQTGEVSLFKGHTEVVVKDRHLAALLFNATR